MIIMKKEEEVDKGKKERRIRIVLCPPKPILLTTNISLLVELNLSQHYVWSLP